MAPNGMIVSILACISAMRKKMMVSAVGRVVAVALIALFVSRGEGQSSSAVMRVVQVIEHFVVDIALPWDDPLSQPRLHTLAIGRFDDDDFADLLGNKGTYVTSRPS